MATIPLYQVDAFASEPFRGNPAAVCLLDAPLPDSAMQAIAGEMNLSETAFVQPLTDGGWLDADRFSLRWFTPVIEVNLCGHATLATAAVLFTEVGVRAEIVRFETLSGTLTAQRVGDEVQLDFPADPPQPCLMPEGIAAALGNPAAETVARGPKMGMLLVHLADAAALATLAPDYPALLAATEASGTKGVIVTAAGDPPYDFISRFFGPAVGVNEDPVTGSAHTVLGPYWRDLLGSDDLLAYQASARGGVLRVSILPESRIGLSGEAVVVFSGKLRLHE
jgi:PhzF family phenazine biosynthesis protein